MQRFARKRPGKAGILCLTGLLLFAFLGMSLHVVLHHHHHHHHHDEHGDHHHGGESPAPHDCPYCVILSTLVFVAVALFRISFLQHAPTPPPVLARVPRALPSLRAHPHRGPPLPHLF